MPMKIDGLGELIGQIEQMANALDNEGPIARKLLKAAAVPIEEQMKANASSDPKRISGDLHGAISTGNIKRRGNGGQSITIGVHRKDWSNEDYYPAYVEYGHGGPGPAPAHPYVRPAFDTRADESYEMIRDGLLKELLK